MSAEQPGTSTHDWSSTVDEQHLTSIRENASTYARGGVQHLILEVLAYADDEARALGRAGSCTITAHDDASISVSDDGRGTDTRRSADGQVVRKPVMATKDLRFFDTDVEVLPDGLPRRGMSIVAALSSRLEHTNHRREGSWTQTYEHGVPHGDLQELPPSVTTGTTVRFNADPQLVHSAPLDTSLVQRFTSVNVHVLD
ncbi:ATP-binding protein [Kineococcus sp. R8]|uniref:ATP-binding protein n=1 Tax=Kineococcus siccus TaxID=2696567 RepID=UPI001413117E|nr:ATP-binding protein [Kineococcus siccus]NAZ82927.1 ATP-binding protein [Kineococcus siccus]